MKRIQTERSPSPEHRVQIGDLQQTVAVTTQPGRPPTLSGQAVTARASVPIASNAHDAASYLPASSLALVDRANASVTPPLRPGGSRAEPTMQIHDLPSDVVNYITHLLSNEKDRLAWDLTCKQNYRIPNTIREIRLVAQHFVAARHVTPALQHKVHLSLLSEEIFSPEAKTLIRLNTAYNIGRAEGNNAQGISWAQFANNMLGEISDEQLEGGFAAYARWTKLPGVLTRHVDNLPIPHSNTSLTTPYFLIAPSLIQRIQNPAAYSDPARLKLCWLDTLLTWSLRCSSADLDGLEASVPANDALHQPSSPAYNSAFPLSAMAKTIIESIDRPQSLTPQFLTTLLALGMRNYQVFSSGEVGGLPLHQAGKELFQEIAALKCFEKFIISAQEIDKSAHVSLLKSVSANILNLQEHRRWSDQHVTDGYPYQGACVLVPSLLVMLHTEAIKAGEEVGINAIILAMQTLESEIWTIRKVLSASNIPGFPIHIAGASEPNSADSEESDTPLIGWEGAFDIIDMHSTSTTPSNPLTELDKQWLEPGPDFIPDRTWEFDQEQRHLLKAIHLTTQTLRDLSQYIAMLPDVIDIGPFKHRLRAIADLWPHEVQRNILLDWINALR